MSSPENIRLIEAEMQRLAQHAWDHDIMLPGIRAWLGNFTGQVLSVEEEQAYALFALSKFMYFSKRLVREMLKSLFRDHFRAPIIQALRRTQGNIRDAAQLDAMFQRELAASRFIGIGNPAESGAHLLYYFRQVNYLPKDLFVDFHGAFEPRSLGDGSVAFAARDPRVKRYIFFDDLVGSGTQAARYLSEDLTGIRSVPDPPELHFLSLFALSEGLARLNTETLFNGAATTLFELDGTYKAFEEASRHFANPPEWFDLAVLRSIVHGYGETLWPGNSMGFHNGQLMLAFSHNTPDNAPPIFWYEGRGRPWAPVFVRYDKVYS